MGGKGKKKGGGTNLHTKLTSTQNRVGEIKVGLLGIRVPGR